MKVPFLVPATFAHTNTTVCPIPLSWLLDLAATLYLIISYHIDDKDLPNEDNLRHMPNTKDTGTNDDQLIPPRTSLSDKNDTGSVLLGTSYPSAKQVNKKIRNGEFVEMANLLPDRQASSGDNEFTKSKKHRIVTNMLEQVWCFGLYISIISNNAPERVSYLLGYQAWLPHLFPDQACYIHMMLVLASWREVLDASQLAAGTVLSQCNLLWIQIGSQLWIRVFKISTEEPRECTPAQGSGNRISLRGDR